MLLSASAEGRRGSACLVLSLTAFSLWRPQCLPHSTPGPCCSNLLSSARAWPPCFPPMWLVFSAPPPPSSLSTGVRVSMDHSRGFPGQSCFSHDRGCLLRGDFWSSVLSNSLSGPAQCRALLDAQEEASCLIYLSLIFICCNMGIIEPHV